MFIRLHSLHDHESPCAHGHFYAPPSVIPPRRLRQLLAKQRWVTNLLGMVKQPFHRGHLRLKENTDIYGTIRNGGKLPVTKQQ